MKASCRPWPFSTERHHTARRTHVCDNCGGPIPAGSEYVVAKAFPGGESGYADHAGHPVVFRLHATKPCHWCPEVAS